MKPLETTVWFTGQFRVLYENGLGLSESLKLLEQSAADPVFQSILREIERSIQKGRALSASLQGYPRYFDTLYLAMIHVGEQSGRLSEVLQALESDLLIHQMLRSKLREALSYPCLMVGVMCGLLLFLCLFVIPQFEHVLARMNTPLPFATRLLFQSIDWMKHKGGWLVLLGLSMGVGLKRRWLKMWKEVKRQPLVLRIPYVGPLYQAILLLFFFRALMLSLASGWSMQEALRLLTPLFVETPFSKLTGCLQTALQQGRALSIVFHQAEVFPPICIAFMRVAEMTGRLDEQCQRLARHFEEQVRRQLTQLSVLLEPLILLLMGSLVGGVVLLVYQPLLSLGNAF